MLGEWNGAEDCVDIDDSNAVFAIDNQPDYVDALHDSGKLVEALPQRSGTAIGVRWEFADGIRMKRKCGNVVTPHRRPESPALACHLWESWPEIVSPRSRELFFSDGGRAAHPFVCFNFLAFTPMRLPSIRARALSRAKCSWRVAHPLAFVSTKLTGGALSLRFLQGRVRCG